MMHKSTEDLVNKNMNRHETSEFRLEGVFEF